MYVIFAHLLTFIVQRFASSSGKLIKLVSASLSLNAMLKNTQKNPFHKEMEINRQLTLIKPQYTVLNAISFATDVAESESCLWCHHLIIVNLQSSQWDFGKKWQKKTPSVVEFWQWKIFTNQKKHLFNQGKAPRTYFEILKSTQTSRLKSIWFPRKWSSTFQERI